MKDTYDLAIIGGGATGLIAAPFAVRLGARVAFIEKDRIGDDCLLIFSKCGRDYEKICKTSEGVDILGFRS